MQRFTEGRDASTPDEIWFLEHPPVFTLGLNGRREHVLAPGDIPVEVRSYVAVFQPRDSLPGNIDRHGQLGGRVAVFFAKPYQFLGEAASAHEWADHSLPPRACIRSTKARRA